MAFSARQSRSQARRGGFQDQRIYRKNQKQGIQEFQAGKRPGCTNWGGTKAGGKKAGILTVSLKIKDDAKCLLPSSQAFGQRRGAWRSSDSSKNSTRGNHDLCQATGSTGNLFLILKRWGDRPLLRTECAYVNKTKWDKGPQEKFMEKSSSVCNTERLPVVSFHAMAAEIHLPPS